MNTNSVPNTGRAPTWSSWLKTTLFKRPQNESLFEIYRGALLGSFTAVLITPGLYGINMAMLKQRFVFQDCMRGVFLNGVNVVPQTAVQVAAFALLSTVLFSQKNKELTLAEKALAASLAGGASGIVTATGEMAVLNYQAQKTVTHKISQIIEQEGAKELFRGSKTRALVVAVACVIVTEAKKVLEWGFLE